jgi:integrase
MGLLPYRYQRPRPYIYTDREIERLLAATRALRPARGLTSERLRSAVSEVLNLKLDDIDLREKVLTIQKSKFCKSRLEPLHPSTQKVLTDYLRQRSRFLTGRPASHLFVSGTGNRLSACEVRGTFCALSRQIGARRIGKAWATPARFSPPVCC